MECTLERGIKDRDHPYVMISTALINDNSVSTKLRFLLIFLLSKKDKWRHDVRKLAEIIGESKDTLYRLIKEGIAAGYITREIQKNPGRFETVRYFVFEEKITVSQNPDTEIATLSNNKQINNERSNVSRARDDTKTVPNVPNVPNVQNERETKERAYERPYKNKPIPHFIKELKTVSDHDKQVLSNQFTEQQLSLALEDALSYHKTQHRIKNTAAFLTERAKFYRKRGR